MGHGLFYKIRLWLLRTIAAGDAVAMNFVGDDEAAVRLRLGQKFFNYNHQVYRQKVGISLDH